MDMQNQKITIGLSQINNSFSGANYLPYSVGLLQAYVEKHPTYKEDFKFLPPVFKRTSVDEALNQLLSA